MPYFTAITSARIDTAISGGVRAPSTDLRAHAGVPLALG